MNSALAHARLRLDVLPMKIFVWMFGHNGELLDSHLFFFDRYSDLADYHRQQGRITKADRLRMNTHAIGRPDASNVSPRPTSSNPFAL